ncbi:unnamed protein product [Microthlaspi erraticum]|uniref:Uncharacterized protein n=1 Tax=Microthlaspi erraticum TaxID=1685480 RepID=A0A6D2JZQ4_9BRAS|nr:unnamed protein product [Microthlaspi erraticum]
MPRRLACLPFPRSGEVEDQASQPQPLQLLASSAHHNFHFPVQSLIRADLPRAMVHGNLTLDLSPSVDFADLVQGSSAETLIPRLLRLWSHGSPEEEICAAVRQSIRANDL